MRSGRRLVLNKKSLRAIENIKIHIKEGCLSEIPSGCGTNKNERLHKKLRKIAGRSWSKWSFNICDPGALYFCGKK